MSSSIPRDAAMFIDIENLIGDVTTGTIAEIPFEALLEQAGRSLIDAGLGARFAVRRVYANWSDSRLISIRKELQVQGLEPVQIFSFGSRQKNAADIEIVCDALAVAADLQQVETFVIVSGDGGYVPLIRRLQLLGKSVAVLTTDLPNAGGVHRTLPRIADHFDTLAIRPTATTTQQVAESAVDNRSCIASALRGSVEKLLDEHPEYRLNDGTLDGAKVGAALARVHGPGAWKALGFASLGALLHECGWEVHRPVRAQRAGGRPDAPAVAERTASDALREPAAPETLALVFDDGVPTAELSPDTLVTIDLEEAFIEAAMAVDER